MDRQIVYTTALPRSTDILQQETNAMYAQGYAIQAAIGTGTFVDGLPCTSGAGVSVNIGSGSIIQQETVDQNSVAFGSLPLDTNTIMKMGLVTTSTNFVLSVPSTPGQSVNYLIEAQLQEADTLPTVLPYYNASNPAVPWAGPGNAGTSQNTRRSQIVAMQVKAGAAGATGSQATPGADSGWVPLWIVTVSYGQSSVSAGNIYRAPQSPFLGTKVGQLRYKLTSNLTLYVTSTGNDSTNNGLSTNVAFATPQAAWNALINNYDLNGYTATINIGAGTFTAISATGQPTGYGSGSLISITGAGATSTFLVSSGAAGAVAINGGAVVSINGLSMSGGYGLVCGTGSQAVISGTVAFGACTYAQIDSTGSVLITNSYSITGAANSHYLTGLGGTITVQGAITVTGPGSALAFSAFAIAGGGAMSVSGITFTGCSSFTGVRYAVTIGGAISTNGGGANYFPGNSAGTGAGTTGFYS